MTSCPAVTRRATGRRLNHGPAGAIPRALRAAYTSPMAGPMTVRISSRGTTTETQAVNCPGESASGGVSIRSGLLVA